MSQKELLYIEDIYNHEKLLVEVLSSTIDCITDEKYAALFEKQMDKHDELIKKIEKLLRGAKNE